MGGWVAVVDHEALPSRPKCVVHFCAAFGPALKGVLEMREG
jgi:hypothetical protein